MIGEIRDPDEIVGRHLPLWKDATKERASAFVKTRRLLAAAIGQHLRVAETGRNYLDEYITLTGREIPIRAYRAVSGEMRPTTVYFHGGGWVSGNLDTHHEVCCLLRDRMGGAVVSVHTRRAPENPFPAQIEDALDAIRYLEGANGLVKIGSEGLILAGDSAGGFIAFHAGLALAGQDRIRGLPLFYPALDPDVGKESYGRYAESPGLTAKTMRRYWDALLGGADGLRRALALESLDRIDRLPPTGVMTAECDPLHDDGTKLVALLKSAGRPVVSMTALGTTHGFCRLVQHEPAARAWVEQMLVEFRELLR